jgi:hypothetical protein
MSLVGLGGVNDGYCERVSKLLSPVGPVLTRRRLGDRLMPTSSWISADFFLEGRPRPRLVPVAVMKFSDRLYLWVTIHLTSISILDCRGSNYMIICVHDADVVAMIWAFGIHLKFWLGFLIILYQKESRREHGPLSIWFKLSSDPEWKP